MKIKYTKEMLFDKALNFESLEEFKTAQEWMYLWALRENHFNELKYTFIARKMKTRQYWIETDEKSFNEAKELNILNLITLSFDYDFDFDVDFATKEANTYELKREWRKFSKKVYTWAKDEKVLDEVEAKF